MKKLKNGSKGPEVKALQVALNKTPPKAKLKPDGVFGAKTEAALKAFQKVKRLKQDGIAGEKTFAALGMGSSDSNGPDWPYPNLESDMAHEAKYYQKVRDVVDKALRIAGKVDNVELAKLEKSLLKEVEEFNRGYRVQHDGTQKLIDLERSFIGARKKTPSACAGILKQAKKLADHSAKALADMHSVAAIIENLAADIANIVKSVPKPRAVERTRKLLARFKALSKKETASLEKSLKICDRYSSPAIDTLRAAFAEMESTSKMPGSPSAESIMHELVGLEVLEIKYNKAIRGQAKSVWQPLKLKIDVAEKQVIDLDKARASQLKKKADMDKELVKLVKQSIAA